MRKNKKIIISTLLIILIFTFSPYLYASEVKVADLAGAFGAADDFLDEGAGQDSPLNEASLKDGSDTLYNVLLVIGVGVAIVWGLVLGIQFVTGSLEDKADIKKGLTTYIFGCVIIFGAFAIWKLVVTMLSGIAS